MNMPQLPVQVRDNPLLLKVRIPGETFRLPSQGLFYKQGELSDDVVNGEVTLRPMTVIDEITLKTPDMLFSGKAAVEVFSRCVPQVLKPLQLLQKDVDFLFACLRLVTYGPEVSVKFNHGCESSLEHTYTTPLRPLIQQARRVDPTSLDTSYTVTLENSQVVCLRPIVYQTIIDINQMSDSFAGKMPEFEEIKQSLFAVMTDTISSVDDIVDRGFIGEWLQTIPAGWATKLSDATETMADWGVDFNFNSKCKDCEQDIQIPIGANPITFFI